ncbi:MAG: iron-sulfur cluster assembly scaffold protein [Rhodobacteraceae bacterium]|nr:iron-sulfur cluster assembly scaffold protein [Paracoccaceae bacterium]
MPDSDLVKLYSDRILALAADIPHMKRLTAPDGTAKKRSHLCGSTVTVDVMLADGQVSDFGQDVKACALGQAAAAVVGAAVIGRTRDEIVQARDQLVAMLKAGGPVPDPPFDKLKVLLPAREYANRHASILLALEATIDAMDVASARQNA